MSATTVNRRGLLTGAGAAALGLSSLRPAFAVPKTLKIGLVAPQTGELAFFTEHLPFVLAQVKAATGGNLKINGTNHPFEIVLRDSQSNPNRASEVAQDLLLNTRVDIVAAFATPATVNPVADQAEINGTPCVTNDTPIEAYFYGRKGDPKVGFDWTFHYFCTTVNIGRSFIAYWNHLPTNKVVGVLWPNDSDGLAYAQSFPPQLRAAGYKVVDTGRFDVPAGSYNAQISRFKAAGVEIVTGVMAPPEFAAFWNACAQQDFRPKVVTVTKALEFPPAVQPYGARAYRLSPEVWWSPDHPFASSLTGQSSRELAGAYEKASGRQWSMPLGFRHSLFEVVFDTLKRAQNLDDAGSIRDALRDTDLKTITGPVNFHSGPLPNTSETPIVMGQWVKGTTYPLDVHIVDNSTAPTIPTNAAPQPIGYS